MTYFKHMRQSTGKYIYVIAALYFVF
jgi:hypothetical protein